MSRRGAAAPATAGTPPGRWSLTSVVLSVVTLSFLLALPGWVGAGDSADPETRPRAAGTAVAAEPFRTAPALLMVHKPNPPRSLRITAIDVHTILIGLGLRPDKTVEVPTNANQAGWFNLGPSPGEPGSSVVLGHVDSTAGPAVFFRLKELARGDRVQVILSDGAVAHFRVTRVATYENENFPAKRVYAGNPQHPVLSLVTCGGAYDRDRGGYQSNVVVSTRWVRTT